MTSTTGQAHMMPLALISQSMILAKATMKFVRAPATQERLHLSVAGLLALRHLASISPLAILMAQSIPVLEKELVIQEYRRLRPGSTPSQTSLRRKLPA